MKTNKFNAQEEALYQKLTELLGDLRATYVEQVLAYAERRYLRDEAYYSVWAPKYARVKEWWNKYYYSMSKGIRYRRWVSWKKDVYGVLVKCVSRYFTLAQYKEKMEQQAYETWESDMQRLTKKCAAQDFVWEEAVVVSRGVTATGIELIMRDSCDRLLNCRAIWAAEYSCLVTPHWRYLVTTKNKRKKQ